VTDRAALPPYPLATRRSSVVVWNRRSYRDIVLVLLRLDRAPAAPDFPAALSSACAAAIAAAVSGDWISSSFRSLLPRVLLSPPAVRRFFPMGFGS